MYFDFFESNLQYRGLIKFSLTRLSDNPQPQILFVILILPQFVRLC